MEEKTRRDLVRTAVLYHRDGLKQSEIAQQMGVSRSLVSKYLIDAEKAGIVEVFIKSESAYSVDLELRLEQAFGLKHAIVLDTNGIENARDVQTLLYQAAARGFMRELSRARSVGISWGTSMRLLVDEFSYENLPNIEVVPLVGGMGSDNFSIHSNQLVHDLSQKLRAHCKFLYAPALVSELATKVALYDNSTVRDVIESGKNVDIAFLGIASTRHGDSTMERIGYITSKELDHLREAGAVGDVNSRFFDEMGNEVYHIINERVIGVNLADISKIETTVTFSDSTSKSDALFVALTRGIVNSVVVTDVVAEDLLRRREGR